MSAPCGVVMLLVICAAAVVCGDDAVELVQLHVDRDDPVPVLFSNSLVRGTNATTPTTGVGSTNASSSNNSSAIDPLKTYQLRITETWGATYQCITELEFYDELLNPIPAEFQGQSSCYGCATDCAACSADYGDPSVQFDAWPHPSQFNEIHPPSTVVHPEKWSCSASGSFFEGRGEQVITFVLKQRPARYILRRLAVGDWVAKDWTLEEQQPDGTWGTLSLVANASKAAVQTVDVQTSGIMIPPPVFPEAWRTCGQGQSAEIMNLSTDDASEVLNHQYIPVTNLVLSNNGHGVQVDGRLGSIELDDGIYDAMQFHFHFPSQHRMNGGEIAAGELHILHKRRWVMGEAPKLAIVTILLDLPLEGSDPQEDELFFRNLDLENLPNESNPRPITSSAGFPSYVDLNAFNRVFASPYMKLPCTDELHWLVLSQPAFVSGFIVKKFRETFCATCEVVPNVDIVGEPTGEGSGPGGEVEKVIYSSPEAEAKRRDFDNRPLPVESQKLAMRGAGEFESLASGEQASQEPAPSEAGPSTLFRPLA